MDCLNHSNTLLKESCFSFEMMFATLLRVSNGSPSKLMRCSSPFKITFRRLFITRKLCYLLLLNILRMCFNLRCWKSTNSIISLYTRPSWLWVTVGGHVLVDDANEHILKRHHFRCLSFSMFVDAYHLRITQHNTIYS